MISASIVLYNTEEHLLENIVSNYSPSESRRLFIIDNSEQKNPYIKKLTSRYVEYIFNNRNMGYGSAHNIGIKKSIELGADYHIVLNPDIEFETEIIDKLIKYADQHTDVVYMLPKVYYPDGSLQYLCKLLPTPRDLIFRRFFSITKKNQQLNEKYELRAFGYDKIINPPCLSGCFMFMRTKALAENNLYFDESFFMYCEDFDLIRRLHRIGKTIFYPEVCIIHNHGHESYKNRKLFFVHMKSACKYFNKYGWITDKERNLMNEKILNEIASLI